MTKEEAKHLSEVLKAYSEGKEIETDAGDGEWVPIRKDPTFTEGPMRYRIKPDPKYRPYKSAVEFLKAQKEHGTFIYKKAKFIRYVGVEFVTNTNIKIHEYSSMTFGNLLLGEFYWQDGTPCGILE